MIFRVYFTLIRCSYAKLMNPGLREGGGLSISKGLARQRDK